MVLLPCDKGTSCVSNLAILLQFLLYRSVPFCASFTDYIHISFSCPMNQFCHSFSPLITVVIEIWKLLTIIFIRVVLLIH